MSRKRVHDVEEELGTLLKKLEEKETFLDLKRAFYALTKMVIFSERAFYKQLQPQAEYGIEASLLDAEGEEYVEKSSECKGDFWFYYYVVLNNECRDIVILPKDFGLLRKVYLGSWGARRDVVERLREYLSKVIPRRTSDFIYHIIRTTIRDKVESELNQTRVLFLKNEDGNGNI